MTPLAIFDMDGVLYRGNIVMPYARETLDRLRQGGWQVFFATNNSTASRADYVKRLTRLGLGGDLDHVITSAYATAHYLERLTPRPADVFVVGANGLRNEIRAVGWRENGRTYINFVVRNGRKYGLMNARLCYSLKDEKGTYLSSNN